MALAKLVKFLNMTIHLIGKRKFGFLAGISQQLQLLVGVDLEILDWA